MPSPRGREYTPTRGPFAGRTFVAPEGRTSGYFAYQQALARYQGFSGYSGERRALRDDMFRVLESRYRAVHGVSTAEARRAVRGLLRDESRSRGNLAPGDRRYTAAQGARKHRAIEWAMDNGLYDTGDDAADEIPY